MNGQLLQDAFGHHVWASVAVLDLCAPLTPEQLDTNVPGTYGSIIDTLRHLVGGDYGYLEVLSPGALEPFDDSAAGIDQLRAAMAATGPVWVALLEGDVDPDRPMTRKGGTLLPEAPRGAPPRRGCWRPWRVSRSRAFAIS